jgi:DNA polymerase-1
MKKLLAFDGTAILRRSIAGAPDLSRPSDGTVTGSAVSFANTVITAIQRFRPTHVVFAFDGPGPSFRTLVDPRYKAMREKAEFDDSQLAQMRMMRDFAACVGTCVDSAPYEADDVLASCAAQFDGSVVLVAADKDSHQCVTEDGRVTVYDWTYKKDKVRGVVIDAAFVTARWGVPPHLVADVQSIAGDGTDGVGGARGVGVKTAAPLVAQAGSVEEFLCRASDFSKSGSVLRKHATQAFSVFYAARLVRMVTDAPLPNFEDCRLRGNWVTRAASLAHALEADRLVSRLSTAFRVPLRNLTPDPRWAARRAPVAKSKKLFGGRR